MQDVSFRNIESFLDYLTEDERLITEYLRKIVFECMPECTEKLSYNVPYYKMKSNICFIWPGSISWGKVRNKGVRFGFTKGYLLTDEINYLDKANRKQVYWRDFNSIDEIDKELLKYYVFEALIIDQKHNDVKLKY